MNFSTPIGVLFGVTIIIWSILGEVSNTKVFLNVHSIGIVIGGTFATALICFNFTQIKNILKILFRQFRGVRQKQRFEVIDEIIKLSILIQESKSLEKEVSLIKQPFLVEALNLYLKGGLGHDDLVSVLEKRVEVQNEKYAREGEIFKVIGKFPPAFGLIGATLGMIGLLQGLGKPDAFDQLGPAMSVALTATFWGLVLANLVLLPLGENLSSAADEDLILREIVVEGVLMLKEKKHPLLVRESLFSYLSPTERERLIIEV